MIYSEIKNQKVEKSKNIVHFLMVVISRLLALADKQGAHPEGVASRTRGSRVST